MSQDKELINAIVRSGLTQLRELDLSDNPGWWNNDEASGYLFDFIKEQTCLVGLNLAKNKFCKEMTREVMQFLLESSNMNSIMSLDISSSADFSEDKTCELLAQLIEQAPQL